MQNVSLMALYQDCSSDHDSSKNMAARSGAYFPYISTQKTLKIFLSETTELISSMILQNCFVGDPLYQDCSSHHDMSKNMAPIGPGLFSLYIFHRNVEDQIKKKMSTVCHIQHCNSIFS